MLRQGVIILTKSLLFALIFLSAMFFAVASYIFVKNEKYTNKVYPNVFINNKSFAGYTKKQVRRYFLTQNKRLEKTTIEIQYAQEIATFSAKTIKLGYDSETAAEQAFLVGRSSNSHARLYQILAALLNVDRFSFTYYPQFDSQPIVEYLTYLDETYSRPPQNALFEVKNGRVTAFKVEKDGVTINTDEALERLGQQVRAIVTKKTGSTKIHITLFAARKKPAVTLSEVNTLGIVEKIGQGTSDYTGSIPGRIHNVILATSRFHGILIPKDTTFSFNTAIGDISASTGYQPAYIIKNGQTVLGDGGGVCQVSTTLFRAALDAGLPITERTAHAYRVHYYENDRKPGFDATVFAPNVDLKFKNDTQSTILIQTEVDKANRIVRFSLYGKKDGRTATVSDATIWDVRSPPEARYQDDPTLPRGVTKQVDWSAPGTKARFHYRVEKGGEIIQDRDFYSNFRPWQAVFLVGTGG